jgi:hypothetical protein
MCGLFHLSASPRCTVRTFDSVHAVARSCLHLRYYVFKPLSVMVSIWDVKPRIEVSTNLPVTGVRWLRNREMEVEIKWP